MNEMSDYVSWTQVEPDHKATNPFENLGRQWWIGELVGFDGGSPVASEVFP